MVEVADRVGCHPTMVYEWVHCFNDCGFATFEQRPNPKRRPLIVTRTQIPRVDRYRGGGPGRAGIALFQLDRAQPSLQGFRGLIDKIATSSQWMGRCRAELTYRSWHSPYNF